MAHLLSSTKTMAPSCRPTKHIAMPQMGLAHPFLLSGIQAISALHLATLIPDRKNEFHTLTLAQESAALPSFRESLKNSNPNPGTINAIFAFAGSIVYYLMASPENFRGVKVDRCRIPRKNDEHPHWFILMRGLMGLVMANWEDLKNGPFRALLDSLPLDSTFTLNTTDDDHLASLEGMFTTDEENEIYKQALLELRILSALSYWPAGTRAIKSSIHMWAGRLSQEVVELIYERDPRALIILAHYRVLLKRNDHVWYLMGLGVELLENIRRALPEEWLTWIQ